MSSLRARIAFVVTLAALLPVVGTSLWARQTIVDRTEEQYARRLDLTVRAARDRVQERAHADRLAVQRLCEPDFVIDSLMLDLEIGRFGPSSQQRLIQNLPPIMRSLRLHTLEILDARASARGEVLASAHYAGRAGAMDVALLNAAVAASEGPFVGSVRVREEGRGRDARVLLTSCEARRGDVRIRILGGRFLDASFVEGLASDVEDVHIVLSEAGPETADDGAQSESEDVHSFVDAEGEVTARLVAVVDDSTLRAQLAELDQGFYFGGGLTVALALLFGMALALSLSRPLAELERAAERVAAGDLESTIGVSSGGEVGRVLSAFNRMTQDLRLTREKLLRAERIAAWRDIARRIAHEIKNPLSPIQVSIETMRKTYKKKHPDFDEIFEESTLTILEEVERLKRIVTEFSQFARLPRPRPVDLDLREVVSHVAGLHQGTDVELEVHEGAALPIIRADREQITQVLVNLVKNASDAARNQEGVQGRVHLVLESGADGGVVLRVQDNGPGIPTDQRARVFEPYFTTKTAGTGLGLAIVHRIVDDHGGGIEVADSPLGGAEITVLLTREGPPREAEISMTDTAVPLVQRRE